jgi:ribose/xylose/arabinose/galactoside ABC-type transport system permease subunit
MQHETTQVEQETVRVEAELPVQAQPGSTPLNRFRSIRVSVAPLHVGGLVAAIAILMAIFQYKNGFFFTSTNILELVRSMSTLAILALGETLVIVAAEIDLSVGAVYGLCAMVFGLTWIHGKPFYVALAVGLLCGAGIGFVNAFFTALVRIPSFIATLGMYSLAQGLTYLISGSLSISPAYTNPPLNANELNTFSNLTHANLPFNIPFQIVWLAVVAVVIWFLLHRSLFGFRLTAIGGNHEAARLAGLPVRRYIFFAFMISGFLAAVAGILDFSFIGSTQPSAGINLTFPVFAAVIIGGASLSGGRGTVMGTLLGTLLLATLADGLSLLLVDPFVQLIFVGSVTIIAVALDRWANVLRVSTSRGHL